ERFASDFRLGSYTYARGTEAALDTRCSPVVLLDVLMQGMKGQGALRWKPGRPIFIGPDGFDDGAELDAHLFYFGSGAPGSIVRFDQERERIARLTRQLAAAADRADRLQREWEAYQSTMAEHLPSLLSGGAELRSLVEELERLNAAAGAIPAARPGFALSGRADGRDRAGAGDRIEVSRRLPSERGTVTSLRPREHAAGPFGRARHAQRRRRGFRPNARLMMLGGGALACTTLAVLALVFVLDGRPPESAAAEAHVPIETPADLPVDESVPAEPAESRSDEPTRPPPTDVVRERAAIDASGRN